MRLLSRGRRHPIRSHRMLAWRCSAVTLLWPLGALCQPSPDAGGALEEIIVTARKIEEDVYRIPMSVQALSGDFVDESDLSSLYEMQFAVPGLVVTNLGMFGAGISLRGVTGQAGGRSLAIAPHFNGVYLGTSRLALARMFDVERIEVLKGPQGTLYGRNATGGSINVISRPADEKFSAAVESALGSFDTVRIRGHVNLPAERVAVRLAAIGSNGDGYIRNTVDDRIVGEQD